MAVEVEDTTDVRSLLAGARGVLFDFDGPVCRLFPGGSSRPVADALRTLVAEAGVAHVLTPEEAADKDPHAVLRAVYRAQRDRRLPRRAGDLVRALEDRVTEGELDAVRRGAWPTPGAAELIRRLSVRGARLAVVTNNAARAAAYYLEREGLRGCFDAVHGRTREVERMKPDPYVVERALASLRLRREEAVMIGDSPADAIAARAAGVPFIGFGRDLRKQSELRGAGAALVVDSYALFLDEA
ncbi:HAD family hydrolase [Streptomyces adustus]|uniref:HAD family hydrolase n=1 Tax=Streptomyces adustus TaxID=1609272 RepID=A0A5N8V6K8_9ACTN|nr:HAD-IA family hydrolase [Streptomyces adustus]MPY30797.1 HAD family hydrolase [Streptomyces adustus]